MQSTTRIWKLIGMSGHRTPENGGDSIAVELQSEGEHYVVGVAGPVDMSIGEVISALRSAVGAIAHSTGDDSGLLSGTSIVPMSEIENPTGGKPS